MKKKKNNLEANINTCSCYGTRKTFFGSTCPICEIDIENVRNLQKELDELFNREGYPMKIVMIKSKKKWYFRIQAANRKILRHSEKYNRSSDCKRAINLITKAKDWFLEER